MSSSSTTTTTKNVAGVKTKATPNSGGHTVKIRTSAELKLKAGDDVAKVSHLKELAKAKAKHDKWLTAIRGDVTDEMKEEVKRKVLMHTMEGMEVQDWWLLDSCFNMMDDYADFAEFTDRLRDAGLDFIYDDNDLALVFDHLNCYRDDMCGAVDSRKVLQAVLELIEAGKAGDAMVQLYNNLTGHANAEEYDFPNNNKEFVEALLDPIKHPGVKLPVIETSKGLLWWCDKPDALPMVVLYKGKRYDAGLFQLSKLPLDVLEDPDAKVSGCFKLDDYRFTLKRNASASNGASSSKPTSVARDAKATGTAEVDGDVSIPCLPYSEDDLKKAKHIMMVHSKDPHDPWLDSDDATERAVAAAKKMYNARQRAKNSAETPLKRSASMDFNGASMPALKRSKSVVPALKRSTSAMDSNGATMPALKRSKSVVQKETKLGKLPSITDGLTRLLDTPEPNGIHFIITDCAKAGFVFGNHTIEYQYDTEEFVTRCVRVANGEGEVLYGTVTLEDGKLRAPITEDALISFGKEEPIFPIGHYIYGSIQPLKRSASAMDSNGATMPALKRSKSMDFNGASMPALKRSKSVVPALKRSASMDSNGVEDAAKQDEVDLSGMPMVYDRPIRFCRDCVEKDHPAGAYDKRGSHTCHLCPNDAEYYDFEYVMNDYNRGGTTLRHGYKCRERCGNACVVKEFDKESYMYNPSPGWVYSNVYSNGFRCFKCRGKEDSLGPEQENFD